jgi:hypothetical protein
MLNEEVELKRKNYSKHPMVWFFFSTLQLSFQILHFATWNLKAK